MIDFRGKSYHEMARIHAFSKGPVCGLYTEDQLKGKPEVVKAKRTFSLKQALLAMTPFLFGSYPKMQAKSLDKLEVRQGAETRIGERVTYSSNSPLKSDTMVIRGTVVEKETGERLVFASILVGDGEMGITADVEGQFELTLEMVDSLVLTASYTGFNSETKIISVDNRKEINEVVFELQPGGMIEYYVVIYPPGKRILNALTWPFRKLKNVFQK